MRYPRIKSSSSWLAQLRGSSESDSAGFSLVEVVVAMVLFSFLAVALLPLLVSVTSSTVVNRDVVRARAAIQQQLAVYERDYPLDDSVSSNSTDAPGPTKDCAALPVNAPFEEQIDSELTLVVNADPCPMAFPNSVSVHLEVFNSAGENLASMYSSLRVTQ